MYDRKVRCQRPNFHKADYHKADTPLSCPSESRLQLAYELFICSESDDSKILPWDGQLAACAPFAPSANSR
jgi:hypothetical protein